MLSSFSFPCYTYSNPKRAPPTPKKGKENSCNRDDLVSIIGPSFENKIWIKALKDKRISKKHKQSLCLVWLVHNILWARDINNNIRVGLIKLSENLEAFNSYPWGYERFKMTVKYLLTPLAPKTVNLYGLPWAFMIVHPSLVLINQELKMSFFLTLWPVQTLSDPKVIDKIKIELFGATAITRKIILEGGLVVVDGLSGDGVVGSRSRAIVGTNDAPLKYLKQTIMSMIILVIQILPLPSNVLHANGKTARQNMMWMKKLLLNSIDTMLLLLWKYKEQKVQNPYVSDIKDPRRPKRDSIASDEEQLIHI
ncbi:hypothetical protein BC332_23424 [Capsicum chinense]|nr:hypothetical protein BC332_23424 [Capsicum chinense]